MKTLLIFIINNILKKLYHKYLYFMFDFCSRIKKRFFPPQKNSVFEFLFEDFISFSKGLSNLERNFLNRILYSSICCHYPVDSLLVS